MILRNYFNEQVIYLWLPSQRFHSTSQKADWATLTCGPDRQDGVTELIPLTKTGEPTEVLNVQPMTPGLID